MKKPLVRVTKKAVNISENDVTDQIFDEEQHAGNSESNGQDGHGKMADSKRRKRKRKTDVNSVRETSVNGNSSKVVEKNDESYRSPMLFRDDNQINKKTKNAKMKIRQKAKKKLPKTQTQHFSDTSIVSESQENTEDLIIEEMNGQILPREMIHPKKCDQAKLNNHSTQYLCSGSSGRTNAPSLEDMYPLHDDTDSCSSVEIPRDALRSSVPCLEGLSQSPSVLLELSDEEDSLIDSERGRKFDFVTISTPRCVHSLSSCGNKEINDCSSRMGSDFTYTYVSTYTEATGTGSTKTSSASPPVKMKVFPNLNSTIRKGKDYIGDIEFPLSISPIVEQKGHTLLQAKCSTHENTFRSDNVESLRAKDKMEKQTQRCSTVLFGSESMCNLPLVSDNLTTIHSGDTEKSDESQVDISDRTPNTKQSVQQSPTTHENNISSRRNEIKEFHKIKQRSFVKASTPRGLAKKFTLNISPIERTVTDSEEFQIYNSTIVNSDEIIVPSPKTPSRDDRIITEHQNETSAAHLLRQTGKKSRKKLTSNLLEQDDACHPHSYSKHSSDRETLCEKSVPQTVATSFRSTCNVQAVEASREENSRSQFEMLTYSKNREIQAKAGKSSNSTPENGNTDGIEVQKKKRSANKHKHSSAIQQHNGSHHQMTNMPPPDEEQDIQQENNTSYEGQGTFSQESLCVYATKKHQHAEHNLKKRKIQTSSTICYINRLCMSSQACIRTEVRKIHQ